MREWLSEADPASLPTESDGHFFKLDAELRENLIANF